MEPIPGGATLTEATQDVLRWTVGDILVEAGVVPTIGQEELPVFRRKIERKSVEQKDLSCPRVARSTTWRVAGFPPDATIRDRTQNL